MVRKTESNRMLDYMVSKLEGSSERITPSKRKLVGDIESNLIFVGENGIVLMVDKTYPRDSFKYLYRIARQGKERVASVVFKDGETFFRSAAEKNYFKKDQMLSLKNYDNEEIQRMMLLRPEEIFLAQNNFGLVQYFQPESPRNEEGLETFRFKPVKFDYSHIDSDYRFKPENTSSKRLHLWGQRQHLTNPLSLDASLLKRRNDSPPFS
ncbi:hypothetical protein FJZ20_02770 [Candidatus Pacearchaeota archaeon]|nr:hypothetical protein [Candidatus Pacearchaeota archaeon]